MRYRFTLSHTPKPSITTPITIPDNSEGENVGTGDEEWTVGSVPSVNLPGEGLITPTQKSKIYAIDFGFNAGLQYTFNYSIDYDIGTNTTGRFVEFVVLNGSDDVVYSDQKLFNSGDVGTLNESSTFTAPAGGVKYGFFVQVTNTLPNAGGSDFEIQNNITGTKSTIPEPGSPTSLEISEPGGWKDMQLIQERHPMFHSLIETLEGGPFIFYGNNGQENGGIDYIRYIEQTYGFNAIIRLLIEYSPDFSVGFSPFYDGTLDLKAKQELPDNIAEIPLLKDSIWTKFIDRLNTPVNLSSGVTIDGDPCDPVPFVTVNLTSQKIVQRYRGTIFDTPDYVGIIANGEYFQIDFDKEEISEIDEKYLLARTDNTQLPPQLFSVQYAGDYEIDLRIDCGENIITNSMQASDTRYEIYIRFNHEEIQLTTETINFGTGDSFTKYTYNGTRALKPTDNIHIYGKRVATGGGLFCMFGANPASYTGIGYIEPSTIDSTFYSLIDPHLYVTAHTIFPESTAEAYLVHDAAAGIIERLVGRNAFYSEFFGSASTNMRQYPENGCGWMYTIVKGLQIRGYTLEEKPFFISFNQWWNGVHPILCLGLGYEQLDGSDIIRVEQMDHFYEDNTSVNFGDVRDITSNYDNDMIFSTIKVGYKKWEAESAGGIDDSQTKRTYTTGL